MAPMKQRRLMATEDAPFGENDGGITAVVIVFTYFKNRVLFSLVFENCKGENGNLCIKLEHRNGAMEMKKLTQIVSNLKSSFIGPLTLGSKREAPVARASNLEFTLVTFSELTPKGIEIP
ncbi:hypothetical protein Tco_0516111 [Tanacetum coccineum]